MIPDLRFQTPALLPAPEPRPTNAFGFPAPTYVYQPETHVTSTPAKDPIIDVWNRRWQRWRDGFEQSIAQRARRYWTLYRAFDTGVASAPGQSWRDRTVIPQIYKIIEGRVPRLVVGQLGKRNWFGVQGRGYDDEQYEELVRTVLEFQFDQIGNRDHHDGGFIKRSIDGWRYQQIMGHVFWKFWWRRQTRRVRTRLPASFDAKGRPSSWQDAEFDEMLYDGADMAWLGLDRVAIDLSGANRWKIERILTTQDALIAEDETYFKEFGQHLYDQATLKSNDIVSSTELQRESYEEPRDTEHWPLSEAGIWWEDAGNRPVEVWNCWDNVTRQLTKIANRSRFLAHGHSPTPDGIDPIISHAAIPIPGRVYGESVIHYAGPLAQLQTRIARARMDEILLNIWQQYVYREGIFPSELLFRPGGGIAVQDLGDNRPVTDQIAVLPRRPVFQEAWQEEGYRQQQSEALSGADNLSLGLEATQKSRDVAATEIQQRVMQGNIRFQLENLYHEAAWKRPMLYRVFDLIRQNMTQPQVLRVMGQPVEVDLRSLDRPIDIILGGGLREATREEEALETQQLIQLASQPTFAGRLNEEELLLEWFENRRRRDARRFVLTDDQIRERMASRQAAVGSLEAPAPAGEGNVVPFQRPQGATPSRGGAEAPGRAGREGPPGAGGEESPAPAASSRRTVEVI